MSLDEASEPVRYVHCNFCNTILEVSVPSSSMCTVVTVRCGHCANLLTVSMPDAVLPRLVLLQGYNQVQRQQQHPSGPEEPMNGSGSSSSMGNTQHMFSCPFHYETHHQQEQPPHRIPPTCPPQKRQRLPSAYNKFIKEEIQRIKASNPDITHREAFSMAAKNWANYPTIHFGIKLDGNNMNKESNLDHPTSIIEGEQ
ncbi:hypothetical protein SAY87_016239 [Trapa incisa]|uniref:YABBY2 n=1 Tax=Trapa incisa TaxID=236973 RepID=A0AAN7L0X9_9MYRT|nr:hypothetical protein SAY87_016239 [Trapa incisa]